MKLPFKNMTGAVLATVVGVSVLILTPSTGQAQSANGAASFGFCKIGAINVPCVKNVGSNTYTGLPTVDANNKLPSSFLPNPSASSLGGVFSGSAAAHQFLTSIGANGSLTFGQPSASDVSGLAPSATTDTTNASNIGSGTLSGARLPAPGASTLGGVKSAAAAANQFLTGIDTTGAPLFAQPSFSNLSGSATASQLAAIYSNPGTFSALQTAGAGFDLTGSGPNGIQGSTNGCHFSFSSQGYLTCVQASVAWRNFTLQAQSIALSSQGGTVSTNNNVLDDGAGNATIAGMLSTSKGVAVPGIYGVQYQQAGALTNFGQIYNDGGFHIAAENASNEAIYESFGRISFRATAGGSELGSMTTGGSPTFSYPNVNANSMLTGTLNATGASTFASTTMVGTTGSGAPGAAVTLRTPAVAQGETPDISFFSTFQNTTGDNGPRKTADIWAGFDGGNWGTEYLALGVGAVGATANDAAIREIEKLRLTRSSVISSVPLFLPNTTNPAITNLYSTVPANGAYISSAPSLSIASTGGHAAGDSLRTEAYFKCTSQTNYATQETCGFFDMLGNQGGTNSWVANKAYPAGTILSNAGNTYTTTNGGTSGANSAPTNTSGTSTDGTITWTYVTNAINNGKEGVTIQATMQKPASGNGGVGNTWGQATALTIGSGSFPAVAGGFATLSEWDIANGDRDCPPAVAGACQTFAMFVEGIGTPNTNTIGLFLGGTGNQYYYFHWGQYFGPNFAKDIAIFDNSLAPIGIQMSGVRTGTGISIFDTTTSKNLIFAQGTYSGPAIDLSGITENAPNAVAVSLAGGQGVALNGTGAVLRYDAANTLFTYTKGGVNFQSYDNGNFAIRSHFSGTGGTPTISSCGTGPSLSTYSTDLDGTITEGTSATGCTLTFAAAYGATPACVIQAHNNSGAPVQAYSVNTGQFVFTNTSSSNNAYSYHCQGR